MRAQNKQRNTSATWRIRNSEEKNSKEKNNRFIRSIFSLFTTCHAPNYDKNCDIFYCTSIFQTINHVTHSLLYFLIYTLNLYFENKILIIIMKLYFFFLTILIEIMFWRLICHCMSCNYHHTKAKLKEKQHHMSCTNAIKSRNFPCQRRWVSQSS